MADTAVIFWGMLFGVVGLGFFVYGKKQKAVVPLLVGIALPVIPYFISNEGLLLLAGAVLAALPWFVKA
ncbi:hypothetical protein G3N55_04820 [Dissulfurirhabdus thermomarina]|uniref:Amino acid transport protein n=1 Tax=Dissulfurirhabdus thermomarina TaxID=1765737 RepID=A0A6N9TM95_DISTH|nr:hypothetical protein [Dissulfurirhabdus thermomarina]NDY42168.1 hypothetical protein [Dissulfurirhabdus thermomarina]NMX22402.1 hypothetical protein [Dissulfurirhabdus thermomarina]